MRAPDATERFSDRVADYVRYRPDYPHALLDWLRDGLGLTPAWRVADIGAGTGISAKMFLDAGHAVTAVEPNAAMRGAAVAWLGGNPRFRAVDGRADATGLPAASVDLVAERYADDDTMRAWFGAGLRGVARFKHYQRLDFDGLQGRLLSSSYAPKSHHPNHAPMLQALRELFDATAVDGKVSMDYDTRIFAGELE
ncbi:MAG: class I SAM-dependent methyltransferase [Proteobacteria bacterium]|nr:class I SAM-dependent methyltransferase [Pseudomonadota bacterium]